jgi:hypothetical protein
MCPESHWFITSAPRFARAKAVNGDGMAVMPHAAHQRLHHRLVAEELVPRLERFSISLNNVLDCSGWRLSVHVGSLSIGYPEVEPGER